ncbi:MAG: hypothetical protein MR008_01895 [Aerococcus sp.]|nr:hypothetical protein [Aerococcus sp.]
MRAIIGVMFLFFAIISVSPNGDFGFFTFIWLLFATNNFVQLIRSIPIYRWFKKQNR